MQYQHLITHINNNNRCTMKFKILFILTALLFSFNAKATLAGKNLVLVHGFISEHLNTRPDFAQLQEESDVYWAAFWGPRAEATLVYPSHERVQGRIKDVVRSQFLEFERTGLCADGCIFVTHSTGDLVLRDALSRLNQWGIDQNRFKVLSVIDLAGAGGGTGLADLAVSTAETRGPITGVVRSIAGAVLDVNFVPGSLGVLNDLRVAAARSIAQQNNSVPRLRVAGAGDAFVRITKGFIRGYDDSVVGMHSACGARFASDARSCSDSIRSNGQLARERGPGSLLFNHFPILMADRGDHNELRSNDIAGGRLTTVINNQTIGGLDLDFQTTTGRKGWSWFTDVREVVGSGDRSISASIFETLNQ